MTGPMTDTTPKTFDLDALEQIAKAATPGPYWWHEHYRCVYAPDGRIMFDRSVGCDDSDRADAAYATAFNPETALALIAALRAEQQARETDASVIDGIIDVLHEYCRALDGKSPVRGNLVALTRKMQEHERSLIYGKQALESQVAALTADLTRAREERDGLRRSVAEITGQDLDTWPEHGNVDLAIAATVALLKAQRDEARAFGEEAARKYNAMLFDLTCAFCGTVYPAETPASGHARLDAHVRVCEAHPMREVEVALTAAQAQAEALRAALQGIARYIDDNRAGGYDVRLVSIQNTAVRVLRHARAALAQPSAPTKEEV